jgi:hypothetical protein
MASYTSQVATAALTRAAGPALPPWRKLHSSIPVALVFQILRVRAGLSRHTNTLFPTAVHVGSAGRKGPRTEIWRESAGAQR